MIKVLRSIIVNTNVISVSLSLEDEFIQAISIKIRICNQIVEIVHIGLMMLIIVKIQLSSVKSRLHSSLYRIIQLRKGEFGSNLIEIEATRYEFRIL